MAAAAAAASAGAVTMQWKWKEQKGIMWTSANKFLLVIFYWETLFSFFSRSIWWENTVVECDFECILLLINAVTFEIEFYFDFGFDRMESV